MEETLALIISLLTYVIIDVLYVKFVSTKIAIPVMTVVQGGRPPRFNILAAFATYCILLIGFIALIPPRVKSIGPIASPWSRLLNSFLVGGMLGLVVYGTFNGTNMSMFEDYTLLMATTDTLWGTFIFTFITFIYWTIISR